MDAEVTVNDPLYIVRRRLGKQLSGSEPRQDQIENIGMVGEEIDENVKKQIRQDYNEEITDVFSDMDDGMGQMSQEMMMGDLEGSDDPKEKIDQYMRVSSLQLAFKGYPVFKSMVVN